jgi:hypothetical protein
MAETPTLGKGPLTTARIAPSVVESSLASSDMARPHGLALRSPSHGWILMIQPRGRFDHDLFENPPFGGEQSSGRLARRAIDGRRDAGGVVL